MVKIEVKPVFWHTMNGFASFGYKDFVVALGYKGEIIKDFFLDYHSRARSLMVKLLNGDVIAISSIEALNKLFD